MGVTDSDARVEASEKKRLPALSELGVPKDLLLAIPAIGELSSSWRTSSSSAVANDIAYASSGACCVRETSSVMLFPYFTSPGSPGAAWCRDIDTGVLPAGWSRVGDLELGGAAAAWSAAGDLADGGRLRDCERCELSPAAW